MKPPTHLILPISGADCAFRFERISWLRNICSRPSSMRLRSGSWCALLLRWTRVGYSWIGLMRPNHNWTRNLPKKKRLHVAQQIPVLKYSRAPTKKNQQPPQRLLVVSSRCPLVLPLVLTQPNSQGAQLRGLSWRRCGWLPFCGEPPSWVVYRSTCLHRYGHMQVDNVDVQGTSLE